MPILSLEGDSEARAGANRESRSSMFRLRLPGGIGDHTGGHDFSFPLLPANSRGRCGTFPLGSRRHPGRRSRGTLEGSPCLAARSLNPCCSRVCCCQGQLSGHHLELPVLPVCPRSISTSTGRLRVEDSRCQALSGLHSWTVREEQDCHVRSNCVGAPKEASPLSDLLIRLSDVLVRLVHGACHGPFLC